MSKENKSFDAEKWDGCKIKEINPDNLVIAIAEEVIHDSSATPEKAERQALKIYNDAKPEQKALINKFVTALCGYQLTTLASTEELIR